MFRVNAHPRQYSKRLGDTLIAKMNVSESVRIMDTEEFFILTLNEQLMILKDYEFVKLKRQEAVFAYEDSLPYVPNTYTLTEKHMKKELLMRSEMILNLTKHI